MPCRTSWPEILPFNILRMIHTNALIVWLLLGFFGSAYYLIPEEAERDIESPMLAYLQLAILMIGALGAVVGYTMGIHEGREFRAAAGSRSASSSAP